MDETLSGYLAILMMATIVFATRLTGYLLGARVPEEGRLRRLLEALPGCAIAAVCAPALLTAGPVQFAGLGVAWGTLWLSGNSTVALLSGLGVLLAGGHLLG